MAIPRPRVCLILLIFWSSSAAQAQLQKIPIPDPAARFAASKLVNEVYADDLAKAKTLEQKQALAKAMIDTAEQEKDPARYYAILSRAMELACDAGDMDIASTAIEKLDAVYAIDVLKLRADVATAVSKNARMAEQSRKLAVQAKSLIDTALMADRYDIARSLSDIAMSSARAGGDANLQSQIAAKVQQARALEIAYADVKDAMVVLVSKPTDAEANLKVGKFLCFVKGDWDSGLPMLSAANDEALKSLAAADAASPGGPEDQVKLAEGWWNLSEKSTGLTQQRMQERALKWYRSALPMLSGLDKLKVEKRLAAIETTTAKVVGHKVIDLLALVDTKKDVIDGTWAMKDGVLTQTAPGKIQLAYHPPAEYDFCTEFSREQGNDYVAMILAVHDRQFAWIMAAWGTWMAFNEVNGLGPRKNKTGVHVSALFENGKRNQVIVKVRTSGLEAYLNGKLISQWKTDYSDMGGYTLKDKNALGLAANNTLTKFYRVEVTEITGSGTVGRENPGP